MANRYEVIVTKECEISLHQSCAYINNVLYAEVAANRLLDKFEELIKLLESAPFTYQKVVRYEKLEIEYRRAVINNYVVIYEVDEENKEVYLHKFFYGGSDYINKL